MNSAVPSLPSTREQIAAVVDALAPKPVNVLADASIDLTVSDLAALGVRRISVGGAFARVAIDGFLRVAARLIDGGTFADVATATTGKQLNGFFAAGGGSGRSLRAIQKESSGKCVWLAQSPQ